MENTPIVEPISLIDANNIASTENVINKEYTAEDIINKMNDFATTKARLIAAKAIDTATIANAVMVTYRQETIITDDVDINTAHVTKVNEACVIAAKTALIAREAIEAASNASKISSADVESKMLLAFHKAMVANRDYRDAIEIHKIACDNRFDETTIKNTYNSKKGWGLIADDAICSYYDACVEGGYEALITDADAGKKFF